MSSPPDVGQPTLEYAPAPSALSGVTYNPSIIYKDRHQGVFRQSFAEFSGRMVPPRLGRGAALLNKNAGLFSGIERQVYHGDRQMNARKMTRAHVSAALSWMVSCVAVA